MALLGTCTDAEMHGSRRGAWGLDPPEKSQKYRVF